LNQDILTMLQENMKTFSKGQKRIANFILESYDKAAFMTASKLGTTVNVSESTVVRFAAELGYDGYPSMQKSLQKMIRNRLTSVQRIEMANDRMGDQDVVSSVLQSDVEKIRATLEEIDRGSFDRAVDAILAAKKIYIIGVRSSSTLAGFLNYSLRMIFDNVRMVQTTSGSEIYEQMMNIGEGDVLVAFSFPRYSKSVIRGVEYAKRAGADVIAITDSSMSPIAESASQLLVAQSDMASFADSLVAPMSLVNALIVAVSRECNDRLSERLHRLEEVWDEYNVYDKTGG
jgi:DNA-binding MurR/RpiR family transcriptional regulator